MPRINKKTRADAKRLGRKYYFTGEPCRNGHIAPRRTAGCECIECLAENKLRRKRVISYREEVNAKVRDYHREYYRKNKEKLAARQIEYSSKPASYQSFKKHLLPCDNPSKAENGDLLVSCYYCQENFTPTRHQITKRIEAINGQYPPGQEHNLYCSTECKSSCSIYRRKERPADKFDMDLLAEWATAVKKKAGYKCERCHSTELLHAHHIEPKSTNPAMAYDVENGVCLCKSCHYTFGHTGDCASANLAKEAC